MKDVNLWYIIDISSCQWFKEVLKPKIVDYVDTACTKNLMIVLYIYSQRVCANEHLTNTR